MWVRMFFLNLKITLTLFSVYVIVLWKQCHCAHPYYIPCVVFRYVVIWWMRTWKTSAVVFCVRWNVIKRPALVVSSNTEMLFPVSVNWLGTEADQDEVRDPRHVLATPIRLWPPLATLDRLSPIPFLVRGLHPGRFRKKGIRRSKMATK